MNSNKINIDDFIRHKVNETSFDRQDEHWQKALELLEDNDGKKRFPLWIVLSAVLLCFIGVGSYWAKEGLSKKSIAQNSVEAKPSTNRNVVTSAEKKYINTIPETEIQQPVEKKNSFRPAQPKLVSNKKYFNKIKDNNKSTIEKEGTEKEVNQQVNNESSAQAFVDHSSSNEINLGSILVAKSEPKTTLALEKNNSVAETKKSFKKKISKKLTTKNNTVMLAQDELMSANNITNNKEDNLVVVESQLKLSKQTSTSNKTKAKAGDSPRYINGLSYSEKQIDLTTPSSSSMNSNADVTNASPKSTENSEINTAKANYYDNKKQKDIRVVAGINASKSIINAGAVNQETGWKPSPYIGLAYYYPITNNISFSTWLAFSTQRGLNANYYTYKSMYGFRKDSLSFHLQFRSLWQIHIPLMVQYKINSNHFVAAGLNANFTMFTRSRFKDFDVSFYQNSFSYGGAFNNFDLMGIINYQYAVSPKMDLMLNYNFGLNDITNNDFFKNAESNKSQKIQIGVTYKLNNNN